MYRVVLVDDEVWDLEGMEKLIPWAELDMEVAAAFQDPFEALSYLEAHAVDILVSDIKMPIMSGLELSRKALVCKPALKIVFVSGYEDFHYAKQAIEMNAHGYVLKPVDDRELIGLLAEVQATLQREAERLALEHVYKHAVSTAQDELLLRWLAGGGSAPAAAAEEAAVRIGIPVAVGRTYQLALAEIDDVVRRLEPLPPQERGTLLQPAEAALIQAAQSAGLFLLCRPDAYRFVLLANSEDSPNIAGVEAGGEAVGRTVNEAADYAVNETVNKAVDQAFDKAVDQAARRAGERLVAAVAKQSKLTITLSIAVPVADFGKLPGAYQEARELLAYKMFCGKNRVITPSDIVPIKEGEAGELDAILQRLFVATANYRLVEIDDCLQELYTLVKQMGRKLTVYNATLHLIAKLDMHLSTLNENLKSMLNIDLEDFDILYQFETVEEIHSWLRRRLFEVSEMLDRKKQKKNSKLVQEIEAYVDEHLEDNLTLRDVANYFSFSPNYLGHLFKEETGENFSDFVIHKRMEKARLLLKDPKLKIYEVAYQVGYKNLTYFSRQFKDRYGFTPGDYRRQSV